MKKPLIAIPSFPGSNGEVDKMRVLRRCGFDCFVFRWNDSLERLQDVDGYFFGAGFSYEDRGRSGMVAARDPLFRFMREEAEKGKVIVGNCNGAQVLVESGLIPLGDGLRMCLARNAIRSDDRWFSPGFLNQWVWITRSCDRDRCATSNWSGALHIPIAHGEGRFTTRDPDLIAQLQQEKQIAFQYCDQNENISAESPITPNGSMLGIAGICNQAGNVVALMPHPERTPLGDPYFHSIRSWIEKKKGIQHSTLAGKSHMKALDIPLHASLSVEIFIDTIITNNEERTVEQAAKRYEPSLRLKQYRYVGLQEDSSAKLLSSLSFFNPNKERAFVRKQGQCRAWNSEKKALEKTTTTIVQGVAFLRRDEPDTGASSVGRGSETGICYDCKEGATEILSRELYEVFCNPHSSTLERLA